MKIMLIVFKAPQETTLGVNQSKSFSTHLMSHVLFRP